MPTEIDLWDARVVVARQLLRNAIDEMKWEDMPDIGESDWLAIMDNCLVIVPQPNNFGEAIALLEKRAEDWHKEHPNEEAY